MPVCIETQRFSVQASLDRAGHRPGPELASSAARYHGENIDSLAALYP